MFRFALLEEKNTDSLLAALNADKMIATAARGGLDEFGDEVYFTNRFIVRLSPGVDASGVVGYFTDLDLSIDYEGPKDASVLVVRFGDDQWSNYASLINTASTNASLLYFVPAKLFQIELLYSPNDPYWDISQVYQWADKQNLEQAYDFALTDDSVVIYFLDGGVVDHEDWPSPFDIIGVNYSRGSQFDSTFDIDTTYGGHGMAVLGVAYAQIDNDTGIAGYNNDNFRVRLHQIFMQNGPLEDDLWAVNSGIAQAVFDAVDAGADIISHSWGVSVCGYVDCMIAWAFSYAHTSGVLSIAAAGNCTDTLHTCCVHFPASLAHVLTVGGLNALGGRHLKSSYGDSLDVMGYYTDIITLDQMGDHGEGGKARERTDCAGGNRNYGCPSGTSFAAPQAAGIAGLVLARRPDLKGDPDKLIEILRFSTDDGGTPCQIDSSFSVELGYGRLDAFRAMLAISRGDLDNDAEITISDLIYMTEYMFNSGPDPVPHVLVADVNCDCEHLIDISDFVYLVDYMFVGGPPPIICYKYWD